MLDRMRVQDRVRLITHPPLQASDPVSSIPFFFKADVTVCRETTWCSSEQVNQALLLLAYAKGISTPRTTNRWEMHPRAKRASRPHLHSHCSIQTHLATTQHPICWCNPMTNSTQVES